MNELSLTARLVWIGKGDDTRLFNAYTKNGDTWSPQSQAGTDRRTSQGPALVGVHGLTRFSGRDAVMSWRGVGDDSHLWASSLVGGTWTPQGPLGDAFTSTHGPALAVGPSNVLVAWKDAASEALMWSQSDGNQWFEPERMSDGWSSHGPALAARTTRPSRPGKEWATIPVCSGRPSTDASGAGRAPRQTARSGTSDRPALAIFRGRVIMAWKGKGDDARIFTSEFRSGAWSPQQAVREGTLGTSHGPALGIVGDRLLMAWKGKGDDPRLFWATFDGSTWTDQRAVADGGVGTSLGPAIGSYPIFEL